ncbi:unnamed protein product, partial [Ilex paraguariensis]
MADGYWNSQPSLHPSASLLKRHRSDYDLPYSGMNDTKTIGSAYASYLQNTQLPSYTSAEVSNFGGVGLGSNVGGGSRALSMADPVGLGQPRAIFSDVAPNGRGIGVGGQLSVDAMARPARESLPLPPDASSTVYVEGLPSNSTTREVAHIFRPFVGYREVRLVIKESRHRGGDPLILCFVDFVNPACAATALSALQ